MTETCVNLVGPVLADVSAFLEAVDEGRHPPLDQQRQKFRKALDDVKKKAAANPELKPVLHPLVYWIDEVLTNSKWTHASERRNYILEFDYFDT
ncbi:MAG: DotU family type IV/VI secretion system protein, partial [Isosphaeraceae bacterium]